MTREDIIRMAREAGWTSSAQDIYPPLERFAALVAAAEREACARIAEEVASRLEPGAGKFYVGSVADFIRNRGLIKLIEENGLTLHGA